MSGSDRDAPQGPWPGVDRRGDADRRGPGSATPRRSPRAREERRSGQDRRDDSEWEPVPLELTLADDDLPGQSLVAAATDARTRAHAKYSGFKVGAALETLDGFVITGCNVENATYGLTLCAERVALVKALSDGRSAFTRIAVVADTADPTPPCGSCRQLLWEYCGDIEVILANLERTTATLRLSTLLPMPFDGRLLE
ncbi:MAG TPA: cytidine deaminase [Vicinamibacterales bacterium]|nr:cytidine deaminase [Vicinamibacterales bacterium]